MIILGSPESARTLTLRRTVKREAFHNTIDNSTLGRRIRAQAFLQATEQTEELTYNYGDNSGIFVGKF
jgi:hypothetical protein